MKLDLYEDYRQGRITRDKFISIQKSRHQEADRLHSSLALLEGRLKMLRIKAERMDSLASDAKVTQMLPHYRPEVIRRLVHCVRVYGAGRIEIDLPENDDDLVEILESVRLDLHNRLLKENPTIGIVLCKDKNNAVVKMTLPEDNTQIFASKYETVFPSKAELQKLLNEQIE